MSRQELLDKLFSLSPESSHFKIMIYLSLVGKICEAKEIIDGTGLKEGTVYPALRRLLKIRLIEQPLEGKYRSLIPFSDIIAEIVKRLQEKGKENTRC